MPGRAPRRYKMDKNGTVRSAFHGKLPEEFTERDIQETKIPTLEKTQTAPPIKLDVSVRAIQPMGNLLGFASVKFNDCFVVEDFKILQTNKGLYVGMPSKPDKTSRTGYRDTAKPVTGGFRKQLQGAVLEAYSAELGRLRAVAAAQEQPSIKSQLEAGAKEAARENAARSHIGNSIALFLMIGLMLPCFLFAMYEKDGLPFEKVLRNIIRTRFLTPRVRPYRTENFYAFLNRGGKHIMRFRSKTKRAIALTAAAVLTATAILPHMYLTPHAAKCKYGNESQHKWTGLKPDTKALSGDFFLVINLWKIQLQFAIMLLEKF